MAALQRAIAANVAIYARPGAVLTYGICSLTRAEGPQVVEALLAQGWRRVPPPPGFPADVLTAEGDLLVTPSRHGMDGFYAARLVRS
jgi:16S rRNA (cytosine967-C5)-methyltransferase